MMPGTMPGVRTADRRDVQRYRVEHLTRYEYAAPVSQSWQLARLSPRELPWQQALSQQVHIDPAADERHESTDCFGNRVTYFAIHGAHHLLQVRLDCTVQVGDRPWSAQTDAPADAPADGRDEPWEAVRDAVRADPTLDDLAPARLCHPTRLVSTGEAVRAYARRFLVPGRPWMQALTALMRGLHADLRFEAGVTTVSTSVDEVLRGRRGVCQDFAHLMLACLRSHGLAARYVSGYLLTDPPPGQARLMGADATHAWVAAFHPRHGWVEFDPTNGQCADRRYITLAWGADFADVVPLRGVILGGSEQALQVQVSVLPID
jgi:transglutaminase-like putative cysteine protease